MGVHLQRFTLAPRFSVGVWYFSPMASRFHDRYRADVSIEARLETIAGLREVGVVGVEAHYPAELNEENLDLWRTWSRQTGIRILTVVPGLFYDREFEWAPSLLLSQTLAGAP
jgi:xylose isomerase